MLAREATNTDIEEMKGRLRKRREDSIIEKSMEDAIRIIRKRPHETVSIEEEKDIEDNTVDTSECSVASVYLLVMYAGALMWNITKIPVFLVAAALFGYKFSMSLGKMRKLDKPRKDGYI